ncbi:MAG: acyl carrier protein [Prolixibacteraceae bacterium]
MNQSQIFEKLKPICHQIFGAGVKITEETVSSDVENWDSMNHVMLISTIENEFQVKFDILEIIELDSIRGFIGLIEKKLG